MTMIADRDHFANDRPKSDRDSAAPPLVADDEADDDTDTDVEPEDDDDRALTTVPRPHFPARLPTSVKLGGIAALILAAAVGVALASVYRFRRRS